MSRRLPSLVVVLNALTIGGAERHTLSLVQGLRHDFDITVVSLKALAPGQAALPVGEGVRSVCVDVRRRFDAAAAARFAAVLDEVAADVLVCVNTYPLLYGHWARARSRVSPRLVSILHTTVLWTWRGRAEMAFYWPLFRRCDDLVFLCDAQRRYWMARGVRARRNALIYNGVDTRRFDADTLGDAPARVRAEHGWSAEDRVLGLCAVLRVEKAHDLLLDAVARLAARGQHWKVLLIGDGPLRGAIEAQVRRLGLQDQVRITGLLSDVRPAVAACDVMTLVSVSETFSMAALEALALGRPMVMSAVGGAAEQVTDGVEGRLFPAGDAEALADALAGCWDREVTTRMGAAAREKVLARFSHTAMLDEYRHLLSQAAPLDELDGQPAAAGPGR